METTNKPAQIPLFWDKGWTYIKTIVDIVREPILILNKDLRVMAVNESFSKLFQVDPKETENKIIYELGNGQWNIPTLRKLLEDILPKNSFFKGFEVEHEFPYIGHKVMILNARQIHFSDEASLRALPPIILLAMEDITELMIVADTLASHANKLETKFIKKTEALETYIAKLEKEIDELKKEHMTHHEKIPPRPGEIL